MAPPHLKPNETYPRDGGDCVAGSFALQTKEECLIATPLWQGSAKFWSEFYAAPYDLVLGTIEAESYGQHDLIGDDGDSFGYGQVQPKWHPEKFLRAAVDNDLSLLLDADGKPNLADLHRQIAANPAFSMAVAVLAIREYWGGATGATFLDRWLVFTRGYVGPQIPTHDIDRRWRIMAKHQRYDSPEA